MEISVRGLDSDKALQVLKSLVDGYERICIVGPSSSGKSYLAKRLAEALNGSVLSTDDFYKADAWREAAILSTFDHPRLIDWKLLLETLSRLDEGEVEVPIYDMTISARTGYRKAKVRKPYILEGIFASYGPLREWCQFKISVESPLHLLLARRMLRDRERAMEAPSRTLDRVVRTVFPMAKLFVEPQTRDADVRVVNEWRPGLPEELEFCGKPKEGKGPKGERRLFELSWNSDKVYIIENFVDEEVEHYVLVSWEGKYIGVKVHSETAYATVSALSAHGYSLKAYYQEGVWVGDELVGELREEVVWKPLGKASCCKLCAVGLDL